MTRTRIALVYIATTVALLTFMLTPAGAWEPAHLTITQDGCGPVTVTAYNPENQLLTVRGGNLWAPGLTIAPHLTRSRQVTTSGQWSVTVNYPGDLTLRTATVNVNIIDCPVTTTTSTTTPHNETTTTTDPGVNDTTTTTAPHGQPPAPPAPPIEVTPKITG
jgi:hypothetical protein